MKGHILLVDDDQNFRFSAELALKKQGYRISATGDGGDALAFIMGAGTESRPFDLILLDMDIPTLSGIEILRKLHGMGMPVPAIVISGHVSTDIYSELLALGCLDILFKPISEKTLIAKVAEFISGPVLGESAPYEVAALP